VAEGDGADDLETRLHDETRGSVHGLFEIHYAFSPGEG
jgi:hypothetical protein